MPTRERIDRTDARLLRALSGDPRSTVLGLAEKLGLSRNTIQARLMRFDAMNTLLPFDRRIDPSSIGYPLAAFVSVRVTQRSLADLASAFSAIPEIIEVTGLSGAADLLLKVVGQDADDLYRIAGQILATPGVERTETSLVMRSLVEYRIDPLLARIAPDD